MQLSKSQWERLADKVAGVLPAYRAFLVEEEEELPLSLYETTEFFSAPPQDAPYRKVERGSEWGGEFSYGWFRAEAVCPQRWKGRAVYLCADTGAVESLVFVNGRPYGMVDTVEGAKEPMFRLHGLLRLPFSDSVSALRLDMEGYAGHSYPGTMPYEKKQTFPLAGYAPARTFRGCRLCVKNEEIDTFLDGLSLFLSLYRACPRDSFEAGGMLHGFAELFRVLSLMPADRLDLESVRAANALLSGLLAPAGEKPALPYVGLVGHSHLDTAWLWPVDETKRKAARTAATAVRLLKRYPEYRFVMSSVQYLAWFEKYYPALFEDVVALAKEGRFELNGAAWIECDCNLVSGESLVRQFLRGQRYLREKIGRTADCFWLPDTFGYSAALPQIMLGCGVRYFCTTKLSWNDTNRFPYDTFWWKGIDRSRVLVHFNTIQAYPDPETVAGRARALANKHLSASALIAYGYGDGGGGPEEKMVESALKMQELAGVPRCGHTTVSEFMAQIKTERLPEYRGELYLELHRGTYTSGHELKKGNRRLERALHDAELLSCTAADAAACKAETDAALDVLLLNQFHDILPGTCIAEVNERAVREVGEAAASLEGLSARLLAEKTESAEGLTLVNTLGFSQKGCFSVAGPVPEGLAGETYTALDGTPRATIAAEIGGFSAVTLEKKKAEKAASPFRYEGGALETPFYTARFDADMALISLFDRAAEREVLAGRGNYLLACEDVPRLWDNWDIDADYRLKLRPAGKLIKSEVVCRGPLSLRLRNTYRIASASRLTQDVVFYASDKRIDFESKLEWAEKHVLLKAYFDTDVVADELRSEIQFGHILRATHENTAVEQARFEVCNQRWSDLSETGYGVALLNDCKYGVSCDEGTLGLTLMKSGTHPDPSADAGVKYFTYSLLPHAGGFSFASVVRPAYELNFPPLAVRGRAEMTPPALSENEAIVVETVKPAEDGRGVVLRLYESEGSKQRTRLRLPSPRRVAETDLLEDEKAVLTERGDTVELCFRPFEIKTLLLR